MDPLRAPAVSVVAGRIAHFCSGDCRERFLKRQKSSPSDLAEPVKKTDVSAGPSVEDIADPFPTPASTEQAALLQSKLLRPQLVATIVLLCIAVSVLILPPVLKGLLSPLVVAVAVLGRLLWGLYRDRRTSWLRMLEGAALPTAAGAVLTTSLFGGHPRLSAVAMALLLATESLGRLFELIGRHRSGVLSAVDDNQQVALPSSWKDNSASSAKIKQLAMIIEWARYPIAVAAAALTYFVTSGALDDSLFAFATVLVGVNPRIIRMATGDSHLAAALIASKRRVSVRDAHAVDALAHADVALFIGKRALLVPPYRVVDWQTIPDLNEQSLLDALLTVESSTTGNIAEAITDFANAGDARAAATTEVERSEGHGVTGTTPWGRLVCGDRTLLLENDILTGLLEKEAEAIEASGRRALFVSLDDKLSAVFGIEETIQPNAELSVRELKHIGIETALTTSAEVLAAESIGKRIGIEAIFFGTGEPRLEEVLQRINARGDKAVLIGNGPHFEEHLRSATAAIAIGNTDTTQAGFDTESPAVTLVPWLVKRCRRANLSVLINLVCGTSVVLCAIGIAASWFSPAVVLFTGATSAAAAAGTTFNAPYPLLNRLTHQIASPFIAAKDFITTKLSPKK